MHKQRSHWVHEASLALAGSRPGSAGGRRVDRLARERGECRPMRGGYIAWVPGSWVKFVRIWAELLTWRIMAKTPLTLPGDTAGLLMSIFVSFPMVSDINYSNRLGKVSHFFRSYEWDVVHGSSEVR